jgi:hypothetical protein
MWRVETQRVQEILASLDEVVRDVLEWGVRHQGQSERELARVLRESEERLAQLARKVPTLRKYLLRLPDVSGVERVLQDFIHWTDKYGAVISGDREITEQSKKNDAHASYESSSESRKVVSLIFRELFRYFYDELWETASLWEVYPGSHGSYGSQGRVTKRDFRRLYTTFRAICPYCDLHTMRYERSSTTDHFLPLTTHPLLAVHWQNLVVACHTCNCSVKGSTRVQFPIYHPYFHQPADHMSFQFLRRERAGTGIGGVGGRTGLELLPFVSD